MCVSVYVYETKQQNLDDDLCKKPPTNDEFLSNVQASAYHLLLPIGLFDSRL